MQTIPVLKFLAFLYGFIVLVSCQITPRGYCGGSCIACSPNAGFTCTPYATQTALTTSCLPYATGNNCASPVFGFDLKFSDKKDYSNWPNVIPPRDCFIFGQTGAIFPASGPYRRTSGTRITLSRVYPFTPEDDAKRIVFRIVVSIIDDRFTQGPDPVQETVDSISVTGFSFLTVEIKEALSQKSLSLDMLTFKKETGASTSCGFLFQYDVIVTSPTAFPRLQFILTETTKSDWAREFSLVSVEVFSGCRGLMSDIGNVPCSACASGLYPLLGPLDSFIQTCLPCDNSCQICQSSQICTACQFSAVFDPILRRCKFDEKYFSIVTDFTVTSGNSLILSPQLGKGITSTSNRIKLSMNLPNSQSFLLKFKLYLQNDLVTRQVPIKMIINGKQQTIPTLLSGYPSKASFPSSTVPTKLFFMNQIIENRLLGDKESKVEVEISFSGTPAIAAVGDIFVAQFKCQTNCGVCTYATNYELVRCARCQGFFDLTTSCQTCSRGFFLEAKSKSCIKCHSTCLECSGTTYDDCRLCFTGFGLGPLIPKTTDCLTCIKNRYFNANFPSCDTLCPAQTDITTILRDPSCENCLSNSNQSDLLSSIFCRACWFTYNLGTAQCRPTADRGYQSYGSDVNKDVVQISSWKGSSPLQKDDCSSAYTQLLGIPNSKQTKAKEDTKISLEIPFLPPHRGVTILAKVFKIGSWLGAPPTILVELGSQGQMQTLPVLSFTEEFGAQVCSKDGNDMIFSLAIPFDEHTSQAAFSFSVLGSHSGLYISQVEMYLGNCQTCSANGFGFKVQYLPVYNFDNTQNGIRVLLKFSRPLGLLTVWNAFNGVQTFSNAFQFSIDKVNNNLRLPAVAMIDRVEVENALEYFITVKGSFINGTMSIRSSLNGDVYVPLRGRTLTQVRSEDNLNRLLLERRVEQLSATTLIDRFEKSNSEDQISIIQLSQFYKVLSWICLIGMIVLTMLGSGIILQELSLMMQLIFLHVYISSNILPAQMKAPLSGMRRMELLNYFTDKSVEQQWAVEPLVSGPFVFTQYHTDIYFLRNFYPTIIINIIYVVWFMLLSGISRIPAVEHSKTSLAKLLRQIAFRPLNYFDSIWRYQFITTIWVCLMQFKQLTNSAPLPRFNAAFTIISFIIAICWPIFVIWQTDRKHLVMTVNRFMFLYEDIFYRKITSMGDSSRYYFYLAVRAFRLLGYCFFVSVFIDQEVIGPVFLILLNILELVYVLSLHIYMDKIYLAFKFVEYLLFIVVAVLMLATAGVSRSATTVEYQTLGSAISSVFVFMLILGMLRTIYIAYKKIRDFLSDKYDVGEKGPIEDIKAVGDEAKPLSARQLLKGPG